MVKVEVCDRGFVFFDYFSYLTEQRVSAVRVTAAYRLSVRLSRSASLACVNVAV